MIVVSQKRFALAGYMLLLFILSISGCSTTKENAPMTKSDILAFHNQILTIDTHVDTPLRLKYEGIDLGQKYNPR